MEAEGLPDGRVRLVILPHPRVRPPAYEEFDRLIGFLSEAREGLCRRRDKFALRVGTTYEDACSLSDELLLNRYDLLGTPRPYDPSTGQFVGGVRGVRKTGTAWDEMPKIDATLLPDGRLTLTLGRGQLAIFANCAEVTLQKLAPTRSDIDENELHSRTGMWSWEVEALRDELQRLDRETRAKGSK